VNSSIERDTITKDPVADRAAAGSRRWYSTVLDRSNLALAAVQMKQALGLSNAALGFAGGVVGIGYAVAAVPSTLALQRVGARRWLSLLMLVWGLCSAGTALVANRSELALARILLGVAEAGFAPGLILYLTFWLPSEYRGRVLASILMVITAGIGVISATPRNRIAVVGRRPGAGGLEVAVPGRRTAHRGAGFCLVFRFLPDRPADARWLHAAAAGLAHRAAGRAGPECRGATGP
jgi:ACS family tartrate transporter-like MFS transporter